MLHHASPRLAAALACALVAPMACGRRAHHHAPGPAEPAHAAASPPSLPPPVVRPAIVPGPSAFAEGGAPTGYEHVVVWDLVPSGDGAAVLLLDASHTTVLPIFVGGTEALTIRLDLDGKHYQRPLTHDLLVSMVRELGGEPIKAQIDDFREETYFGSVFVRQGERVLRLDARPSDAIAIALGSGAPLYVSRSVMLASGVPREALERAQKGGEISRKKSPLSL